MTLSSGAQNARQPFLVSFSIIHYLNVEPIDWHAQLQLAKIGDPTFSSPLIDVNSSANQARWNYRDEQTDADDGTWQAWPAGGVRTNRSKAQLIALYRDGNAEQPLVASAIYSVTTSAQLAGIPNGTLLARARQSPDGGATWGDWIQWQL